MPVQYAIGQASFAFIRMKSWICYVTVAPVHPEFGTTLARRLNQSRVSAAFLLSLFAI